VPSVLRLRRPTADGCYAAGVSRLYELYEQRVFPHLLDIAMRPLERYRGRALADARGAVLEIGFGTGLNLPFYPSAVEELTTVDPMQASPRGLRERLAAAPFPVHRHQLPADGVLPFPAATFDCVVVTWTLCTIPDPVCALREMRRVARDSAPLLFVEHGRSDAEQVAAWQDRLNAAQQWIACGCHLNRAVDRLIEASGFELCSLDRFDAPHLPRTHGHLYLGSARPA